MGLLDRVLGLSVVGANFRTAPIEVRESLALGPDQVREALRHTRGDRVLDEAMILSTCNRTEFYSFASRPEHAEAYVRDLVVRMKGSDILQPGPHRYVFRDRDMVSHLFRVVASLDSLVLGEMQILGQVKDAYALATEGGAAGAYLNQLLGAAMRVGKRARAETEIGEGAVSIASAAVTLTLKVVRDLKDRRILVIGAGETGRLVAQHFSSHHPAGILVANRSAGAAHALAAEVGGEALTLDGLQGALERADVVACATRSPEVLLTARMIQEASRRRRHRPLVIVDISIPRNVDPAAARLENVFLYPIDALQSLIEQNLTRRRREIPKVEAIINEEMESFFRWTSTLRVTPVIKALREHFETVRHQEVERAMRQFSEGDVPKVQALTRAIVNKLLHDPMMAIKRASAEAEDGAARLDAACQLFNLDIDGSPEKPPGEGPA